MRIVFSVEIQWLKLIRPKIVQINYRRSAVAAARSGLNQNCFSLILMFGFGEFRKLPPPSKCCSNWANNLIKSWRGRESGGIIDRECAFAGADSIRRLLPAEGEGWLMAFLIKNVFNVLLCLYYIKCLEIFQKKSLEKRRKWKLRGRKTTAKWMGKKLFGSKNHKSCDPRDCAPSGLKWSETQTGVKAANETDSKVLSHKKGPRKIGLERIMNISSRLGKHPKVGRKKRGKGREDDVS